MIQMRMNTEASTIQLLSVTWITDWDAASASMRMTPNDWRTVDVLGCSIARQRDLKNSEEWAYSKLRKFNRQIRNPALFVE